MGGDSKEIIRALKLRNACALEDDEVANGGRAPASIAAGINMRLSQAELELIETVRHWDAQNFTLTIRVDKGRWNASLEDHDRDLVATGTGSDFNSAWNDIVDPRLR